MVYKYPTRRPPRETPQYIDIPSGDPKEDEPIGLVQGQTPASRPEWFAAQALNYWKISYRYQVPIAGGRLLRAGQVLDFLLYIPLPWPLQIFGEHWHTGQLGDDDYLGLALLRQEYGRDPFILWGVDLIDRATAIKTVGEQIPHA